MGKRQSAKVKGVSKPVIENNVYDFAFDVLFRKRKNTIGSETRDSIFHSVLKSFNEQPVKIFQIGCIETFNINWRVGSGWSDLIFGDYIKKYGGKLSLCDISLDTIAHSRLAAHELGYSHLVETCYGDAINFIEEDVYDIYYLDGSNDPQETLDQFLKVKHNNAVIIVDDFQIKGTLLNDFEFEVFKIANGVGVLNLRNQHK